MTHSSAGAPGLPQHDLGSLIPVSLSFQSLSRSLWTKKRHQKNQFHILSNYCHFLPWYHQQPKSLPKSSAFNHTWAQPQFVAGTSSYLIYNLYNPSALVWVPDCLAQYTCCYTFSIQIYLTYCDSRETYYGRGWEGAENLLLTTTCNSGSGGLQYLWPPQAFALHAHTTTSNRHTCMHIKKINFENNKNAYLLIFWNLNRCRIIKFHTSTTLVLKFI